VKGDGKGFFAKLFGKKPKSLKSEKANPVEAAAAEPAAEVAAAEPAVEAAAAEPAAEVAEPAAPAAEPVAERVA
jgi:hypothetical protein